MAKAVTLKNNNNEEVYPVTDLSLVNGNIPTGRIADNAITTSKIADGAVTSDKIDWATYTPVWTTYDIRDIYTDVTSLQLKTRLGRPFTAKVINNSTGVVIENLDSSIRLVRVTIMSRFANNTSNIGINGVAPNSKVWTYCVGNNNGTTVNLGSGNEVGGYTYTNALTGTWNGNKNALSATYTATRSDAGRAWVLKGQLMCAGSATWADFTIECTATDNNTVPGLYCRGVSGTTFSSICFEILESK